MHIRNQQFQSSIEVLRKLLAEVRFGSIKIHVRDGVIAEEPRPIKKFTRKPAPCGRQLREPRATQKLDTALQDLHQDILHLRGSWSVKIKVTDAQPTIWERKETGVSATAIK